MSVNISDKRKNVGNPLRQKKNPEISEISGFFFWRSRRDSNPRAALTATRFPIVLVMTTSILLRIGQQTYYIRNFLIVKCFLGEILWKIILFARREVAPLRAGEGTIGFPPPGRSRPPGAGTAAGGPPPWPASGTGRAWRRGAAAGGPSSAAGHTDGTGGADPARSGRR